MKIQDILKKSFLTTLCEIEAHHFRPLVGVLHKVANKNGLNLVVTYHSFDQLMTNKDEERTSIEAADVYRSVEKFFRLEKDNLQRFKSRKREYEGIITNPETGLNLVVAIDYHKPARLGQFNNFKIVTGINKENFKSDNFNNSNRVYV